MAELPLAPVLYALIAIISGVNSYYAGTRAIRSDSLFYQTIAEHFETWHELASAGQFDGQGDHRTPKPYVRQAFRKYLECGIFAHPFAQSWCDDCGHDYFVAYCHEAGRACQHERGRTWSGAAGPYHLTHARACTTQAFTGTLLVGGADRSHLRGVPAAVPEVWWADAPDRICHRGHVDQDDP